MREIVLDTETTGFYPDKGDRLVEIGCVELVNHLPTGRDLQLYINPERDMPAEAERVHGLTAEFLSDKPVFADVVDEFLEFIDDSKLIIHNASFDMKFLNAELTWLSKPTLDYKRAIDTLLIARQKFPGSPVSLDALCRRFSIDLSDRTKHGAIIDCLLLSEVYLELIGGRQPDLSFDTQKSSSDSDHLPRESVSSSEFQTQEELVTMAETRTRRSPRLSPVSPEEEEAHCAFLEKVSDPIWNRS